MSHTFSSICTLWHTLASLSGSQVIDPLTATTVDLNNDVRVVKKLGGTLEDTELVEGLVFTNQKVRIERD